MAAIGTAAACSKRDVRWLGGQGVLGDGRVLGIGAGAPAEDVVPDLEPGDAEPTASTVPATSVPRTMCFGLRSP